MRYIGNNGLEYTNEFDAEKYGEGLSHAVEYTAPKRVEMKPGQATHTPEKLGGIGNPIGSSIPKHVTPPSTEILEDASSRADVLDTLDQVQQLDEISLRQKAKELGIKSWHNTGLEKLKEQIQKELEKSLA